MPWYSWHLSQMNETRNIQVMTIWMYTNNYSIIEIATGVQLIYRCNIDRLKLMRKPLPLEGDMKYVWQKIQKVIDPLHISNHKVFLIIYFMKYFNFEIQIWSGQHAVFCIHHLKCPKIIRMPTWWHVRNCLPGLGG